MLDSLRKFLDGDAAAGGRRRLRGPAVMGPRRSPNLRAHGPSAARDPAGRTGRDRSRQVQRGCRRRPCLGPRVVTGGFERGRGGDLRQACPHVLSGCAYVDEGVWTPDGFPGRSCRTWISLNGPGYAVSNRTHPQLLEALRPLADAVGVIATVSTCSGTDALAFERAARNRARIAESMEARPSLTPRIAWACPLPSCG